MTMTRTVRWLPGARSLNMASLVALLIVIALAGGTSRADSLAQVVVRAAAVLALAGWMLAGRARSYHGLGWPIGFAAAAVAIVGAQLIPLPPGLWSALPGRAFYAQSAAVAGIPAPWRPLAFLPDRAWAALFSMLVPVAVLAGLARIGGRERATLTGPVLALVMVSAVLGLAQMSAGPESWLRWYEYTNETSAVGLLANRNHQALLLACGLPVAAAWATMAERGDRPWVRGWIALGLGAFLILMLPTTGSRAGVGLTAVGALAAAAIAGPAAWRRLGRLRSRRRRMVVWGGALALVLFAAVLFFFGRNEAILRLQDLNAADDARARTLPIVWKMAMEFFPLGAGFGSFDTLYRRFEPFEFLSFTYLNQAHNDVLQLLLEGGVAAVAVAVVGVGWWGWASVRVWRAPVSARIHAGRAGSAVIAMAIAASAVDYPLRTPLMLALFAIAAAWLGTALARAEASDDEGGGRMTALR